MVETAATYIYSSRLNIFWHSYGSGWEEEWQTKEYMTSPDVIKLVTKGFEKFVNSFLTCDNSIDH